MKLTRERLKQIIKEELEEAQETDAELSALTKNAGVPNLPTPEQDPYSFQTSPMEKAIEELIKKNGLKESDINAKLLRLTGHLIDAKGENKELYIRLIKDLLNNMSIKKEVAPVQEKRKR